MPSACPRSSGPRLLLDDAGLDVGKRRELRRERQARRAAADDEDIDLVRNGARLRRRADTRSRGSAISGSPGSEAVQMELHRDLSRG